MTEENVIPKFPKKHGEIHPIYHQKEIDRWRVETIKALKEIRDSPKNLSLEEGQDVVPDLIKELLKALEEEKKETTRK